MTMLCCSFSRECAAKSHRVWRCPMLARCMLRFGVCLSVCLSQAGVLSKSLSVSSRDQHHTAAQKLHERSCLFFNPTESPQTGVPNTDGVSSSAIVCAASDKIWIDMRRRSGVFMGMPLGHGISLWESNLAKKSYYFWFYVGGLKLLYYKSNRIGALTY